jgi:Fe-Mn family superoxide dismutase
MLYTAKNYGELIGMQGFSETLLNNHFTLYQGYVTNTNKLLESLDQMLKSDRSGTPEYAELKRRLGWELNGMRLHELYFDNLGGDGELNRNSLLTMKIVESYGSYDAWEKDFRTIGAMRGVGWTILYMDPVSGRLINFWVNEHDAGHPTGFEPLLIMDVFEHAFITDYGLKRADYIEAFFRNINWSKVGLRIDKAAELLKVA